MKSVLRRSLILFALVVAAPAAHADAELQAFVEQTLAKARDQHKLPGIAAVVQIGGKLEAEVAMGLRASGHPERVTTNDRWHIGSDTKAMTATLIARLVEYGKLRFEDTLADAFPELSSSMAPAYRAVTITQLLSHTAGLPPLTDDKELPPFYAAINGITALPAQRAAVTRAYLAMPPASKVGEFAYSNLGFIIAGAIAEARTGKSWEDLVREQKPILQCNVHRACGADRWRVVRVGTAGVQRASLVVTLRLFDFAGGAWCAEASVHDAKRREYLLAHQVFP
jgi:CubicO group peptidase (beta-lactamase class C family)